MSRGRTICPHRTGANSCGKFSGQLQQLPFNTIRVSGAVIRTTRQASVDVPTGAERKGRPQQFIQHCGLAAKRRANLRKGRRQRPTISEWLGSLSRSIYLATD